MRYKICADPEEVKWSFPEIAEKRAASQESGELLLGIPR
jgi:hypothetical protein